MTDPNFDSTRYRNMLENIQQQDPEIDHIIVYSKFVVAYWLEQDTPNPGWRKANVEGPVYLVRRRALPRYQLLVKNQFSTDDLLDSLHPDWELDCQKNYVFYKVEQANQRIRGLWFHDDSERKVLESALLKVLQELSDPQVQQPLPAAQEQKVDMMQQHHGGGGMAMHQQSAAAAQPAAKNKAQPQQPTIAKPGEEKVMVTASSLQKALHALADDENFLAMVMQKLTEWQPAKR